MEKNHYAEPAKLCAMIVVIKKRCKECNTLRTDFYKYKNNEIYSTCIECFNKKVKSENCNKEFNKTFLLKRIERCLIKKLHMNDYIIENHLKIIVQRLMKL